MTNTLNSLLFTSMNVPPKIHPNRGERNAVLINNHLPISNEGHFISFTLVVSPSSNTLMRNSFTLFISLVLMIYDTKEAYRYARSTHSYRLLSNNIWTKRFDIEITLDKHKNHQKKNGTLMAVYGKAKFDFYFRTLRPETEKQPWIQKDFVQSVSRSLN